MKTLSLQEMLEAAMHFGHKTQKWNPKMKRYLYGKRNGIHIFDLQQTAQEMQKTLEFLHQSVLDGKKILFVGTKQHTTDLLKEIQKESGMPIVANRWVGGMLTNFPTIKARVHKLKKIKKEEEGGALERYTKKEQSKIKDEIKKLENAFGGISEMFSLPEIVFVIDGHREKIAIKEAQKLNLKVVGICDSNADPDDFDYLIPANDDALKSVTYVLDFVKAVILDAQKSKPKKEKESDKTEKLNQEEAEKTA